MLSIICSCVTASVDESQLIHASGNSKQVWQIPDVACTDLSSWWWAEKPLETCRALTVLKSIIQRCIMLVMLKNTLTMHGRMNVECIVTYWCAVISEWQGLFGLVYFLFERMHYFMCWYNYSLSFLELLSLAVTLCDKEMANASKNLTYW
jgi:hypothetical protein